MEISQLFPDRIKEGTGQVVHPVFYMNDPKRKKLNLKYIDTRISHKVPLVKKTKRGNIVGEFKPKREFIWRTTHTPPPSLFLNSDQVSIPSVTTYFTSRRIFKKRERERDRRLERGLIYNQLCISIFRSHKE